MEYTELSKSTKIEQEEKAGYDNECRGDDVDVDGFVSCDIRTR